jgi:hypothetical protein
MNEILIATPARHWQKSHATNSTDTSFTSRVDVATKPSGDGFIILDNVAGRSSNNLLIQFFGTGSDNDTFDARIYGWRLCGSTWMPQILLEITATLSGAVGISGGALSASERYADTIVQKTAFDDGEDIGFRFILPGTDLRATLIIDNLGCPLLGIDFDRTGATACNALVAQL